MEILNNDINKIKAAILNEDHNYLCKIGHWTKTAKRMILELKIRLNQKTFNILATTQQVPNLILTQSTRCSASDTNAII